MEAAWTKTAPECLKSLGVDAKQGLSQKEAEQRLNKYGPNGAYPRCRLSTCQQSY